MNNIELYVLTIINVIGFSFVIISHKSIFEFMDTLCTQLRKFIVDNSGIFTMLFLFLFFLEQLILILLASSKIFTDSNRLQVLISVFALIVVTTATLEKFVWEYKYNNARNRLNERIHENSLNIIKMREEVRKKIRSLI